MAVSANLLQMTRVVESCLFVPFQQTYSTTSVPSGHAYEQVWIPTFLIIWLYIQCTVKLLNF